MLWRILLVLRGHQLPLAAACSATNVSPRLCPLASLLFPSFVCAHRFSEGLEYVRGLSRPEAAASLQKYGKVGGRRG